MIEHTCLYMADKCLVIWNVEFITENVYKLFKDSHYICMEWLDHPMMDALGRHSPIRLGHNLVGEYFTAYCANEREL